jgi:hypothetical protein
MKGTPSPPPLPWVQFGDIIGKLDGLTQRFDTLLSREGIPAPEVEAGALVKTREVKLTDTFIPGSSARLFDYCPLTGKITQIVRHWPLGCAALVDMAVGHGDRWMLPNALNLYVALDSATLVTNVDEPVIKGEELWTRIQNRDSVNNHIPTVTFIIQGVE